MQSSINKLKEKINDADSASFLSAASLKQSKSIAMELKQQLHVAHLNELKYLSNFPNECERSFDSEEEFRGFSKSNIK